MQSQQPTDDNPLNYSQFGKPLRDGVLVNEMPELRYYIDTHAITADIIHTVTLIERVRARSEEALDRKVEEREVIEAQCWFTTAVISYGRCFTASDGRRKLTDGDVKRLGGEASIHEELMVLRDEVYAHRARVHRRTEIFALIDVTGANRKLESFACIESYYPLPTIQRLREYERHLNFMANAGLAEVKRDNDRLVALLGPTLTDKLYDLLAARQAWS